ncbi:MAG: Panacea domain-containing protein [Bacteroidota bacterium]
MIQIEFNLNQQKTLETILYIATRIKNPTKHTIFKIMYFADKEHLLKYGRFITGDYYIAMEYGPVPSGAYDLIKTLPESMRVEGYHIVPDRDAKLDEFSESDIECLNASIEENGNKSFGQLTDESHDEAWKIAPENGVMTIESIAKMLDSSDELLSFLEDQHP